MVRMVRDSRLSKLTVVLKFNATRLLRAAIMGLRRPVE